MRLQMDLTVCPSVLSAEQVEAITGAVQQMTERVGPDMTAQQAASLWRGCNQLLGMYTPADLKQGLRRLLTTLIEEATTHEIIADPDDVVPAFLEEHPSWWQGSTRFSAADPTWGSLWVLTRPASVAFTRWIRAGGLTGVTK